MYPKTVAQNSKQFPTHDFICLETKQYSTHRFASPDIFGQHQEEDVNVS